MKKRSFPVLPCGALILVAMSMGAEASAQQAFGFSLGYEVFPHVKLADPVTGFEDFEIGASAWSAGVAFPLSFARGRIVVLNRLDYRRTEFTYGSFPSTGPRVEQVQSVDYTFFLIDSLSPRWKVVALVNPGLASDFGARVSGNDVTFDGALGFIRQMSKSFQLGLGAAYTSDFGEPLPLPFLYVDWEVTSKLTANGILPTNLNLAYRVSPRVDTGLTFRVVGSRYHGDPARFETADPRLKYSEGTLSPSVQLHLSSWLHLNAEGGFAFYRNFEFLEGNVSAGSYDLKKSGYLRTAVMLGM